jgi:hypothetical protein
MSWFDKIFNLQEAFFNIIEFSLLLPDAAQFFAGRRAADDLVKVNGLGYID